MMPIKIIAAPGKIGTMVLKIPTSKNTHTTAHLKISAQSKCIFTNIKKYQNLLNFGSDLKNSQLNFILQFLIFLFLTTAGKQARKLEHKSIIKQHGNIISLVAGFIFCFHSSLAASRMGFWTKNKRRVQYYFIVELPPSPTLQKQNNIYYFLGICYELFMY